MPCAYKKSWKRTSARNYAKGPVDSTVEVTLGLKVGVPSVVTVGLIAGVA